MPRRDGGEILAAIAQLQRLLTIQATAERASLLGSAYKRLAIREAGSERRTEAWRKAVDAVKKSYSHAVEILEAANADNLFYPTFNRMIAGLLFNLGKAGGGGLPAADLSVVHKSLQEKARTNADFWSVVGATEVRIYEALANRSLAASVEGLVLDLTNVKARRMRRASGRRSGTRRFSR